MARLVRSLPSVATFRSVPTKTITRLADLIAASVAAEQSAAAVAVVEVPQESYVTCAFGFAAWTAAVIPCTAFTWSEGSPE